MDWDDDFLAGFDIVVVSVHTQLRQPRDQMTARLVRDARLTMDNGAHMFGHGTARRNPADPDVTGIGEEIAVARALSDLAHMLLSTAVTELEDLTHERTQLRL